MWLNNINSVLILGFLKILGIIKPNDASNLTGNKTELKLCTSKICEEIGNEMIKDLDQSVNPCDNFFKHACGGWNANNLTPNRRNQIDIRKLKVLEQLREILQDKKISDSKTLRKVRDYYRSCENLVAIDAKGLTPVESIVLANGGWPLTLSSNNWSLTDENLTLQKIHEDYHKITNKPAIFDVNIDADPITPNIKILHLNFPITPLHELASSKPITSAHMTLYTEYINAVATEFAGLRGFKANITNDVSKILKFEASLNKLKYNDSPYTVMTYGTIDELQNMWNKAISGYPEYEIDWLEYIRSVFKASGVVIYKTERIVFNEDNIIENFGSLLKQYPLRTVVDYVHWHAINSLMPYTSNKNIQKNINGLLKAFSLNADIEDQRSMHCIRHHKMNLGLSYVYVRKYFSKNILLTATEMVSRFTAEMKRQFNQTTWLEDYYKHEFQGLLDRMKMNIGYPSWYDEPGKMDEYYSELTVGPDYFINVMKYNSFERTISVQELRKPDDRSRWIGSPLTAGIFYSLYDNTLTLPAVLFQLPYFDVTRPLIMNYGGMGIIIGQGLFYAFEPTNQPYDILGYIGQLWSYSMVARYNEKTKCFADQYSEYKETENITIKIDSKEILGEYIADNSGLMIALKAYLSHKKEHKLEDIRLPVLKHYTNEQLFFYSFSHSLCSVVKPETEMTLIDRKHAFNSVKVNGIVSNMREFAEAFNCPSGSPMNPVKKCVMWN